MIRESQKGIALLIVMWALAILMVIVLSISYMTRIEIRSTIAFREGIEEKFIAEAGIEMAASEIMYKKLNFGVPVEAGKDRNTWMTDGTPNQFVMDNGTGLVRIIDESGKVDINKTPEIIFKGLLVSLGVKEEDAAGIVDSVQDWRDADDLVRLHGAESSYYSTLPIPYKAKNADFESIEELLLVKGITSELFYGSGSKTGLADFVTVYSESGKINPNAAPREVLMALPGITTEIAAAVTEFRKNSEANVGAAIQNIIGPAYAGVSAFVNIGEGSTFTVESVGRKSSGKAGYGVKAVITIYGNKFSYKYFRSPWDMTKWKQPEKKDND